MNEFDKFSENYADVVDKSVKFSGLDLDFFTKVKVDKILRIIESKESAVVLDFGCGTGTTDQWLSKALKNLHGIDISEKSIHVANKACPQVTYKAYDPPTIPYKDNFFDFIFTVNVLHHVPKDQHSKTIGELCRVLKRNGKLIVFEHNPLNPVTRHVFNNCPLDVNAEMLKPTYLKHLFSGCKLEHKTTEYILFFPLKNSFFRKVEYWLKNIPFGAQYVAIAKKT